MTTKRCPKCGNTHLVRVSSQNKKYCTDCHTVINWKREKGEPSYYA